MGEKSDEEGVAHAGSYTREGDEGVVFTFSRKTDCRVKSSKNARRGYRKGKNRNGRVSFIVVAFQEVNDAVMKEYLQRVYNSILSHPDILSLGEGIAQLLVQQAQSVVLMHR